MSRGIAMMLVAMVALGAARPANSQQLFDSTTIGTVSGRVVEVHRTPQGGTGDCLVFLTLRAAAETLAVRVGPGSVLARARMVLTPGDSVDVTGSRITLFGEPTIVATELRAGGRTLALRDRKGRAVW